VHYHVGARAPVQVHNRAPCTDAERALRTSLHTPRNGNLYFTFLRPDLYQKGESREGRRPETARAWPLLVWLKQLTRAPGARLLSGARGHLCVNSMMTPSRFTPYCCTHVPLRVSVFSDWCWHLRCDGNRTVHPAISAVATKVYFPSSQRERNGQFPWDSAFPDANASILGIRQMKRVFNVINDQLSSGRHVSPIAHLTTTRQLDP
jgi:hypothetical protein